MKENPLRKGATTPDFLISRAGRPIGRRRLFGALAALAIGALVATPAAAQKARRTGHRQTGTVKWFNKTKGYGFIIPDDGDGHHDLFVHISAVERAGLETLREGQKVSYVIVMERGKPTADDIRIVQ